VGRRQNKTQVLYSSRQTKQQERGVSPIPNTEGAHRRRIRPGRLAFVIVIAVVVLGAAGVGALVLRELSKLPSVANLAQVNATAVIYDREGQPVTTVWGQKSEPLALNQMPRNLVNAVVATEDHRFWSESGIDWLALIRAFIDDIVHRGAVSGASTIPEQLGKIHYLVDNRSISYKIAEILLGLEISRDYTKQQILDMYLNQVYLGEGATGVGAASEIYFSKPAKSLTLAQAAMLAGLPDAPSAYDPLQHYGLAKKRQLVVLDAMVANGYITQAQANAAYRAPLGLAKGNISSNSYRYPWFVDAVVEVLLQHHISMHEIQTGGLRIYTTLDPQVEQDAVNAVAQVMNPAFGAPNGTTTPEPEAAVVVMDPKNGYVLALVGGRQHSNILGFNRATSAYRQSGSAIKPIAEYPAAIEMGYTAASVVDDGPWMIQNGQPWPQNDNHQYQGRITLTEALAISDNNVSVRLASMVGVDQTFNTATQQFGLPLVASGKYNDKTLAMAIGGLTRGVTPLDMATAYATYPNGGYRPTPILVTKVVAPDGQVLFSQAPHLKKVISPQVSYIMTQMMEQVFTFPGATAQGKGIGRPAAGKTGTAQNGQDGWFIGYTPQLVTAVWEGYDSPRPQAHIFGATYALPIWRDTMLQAVKDLPPANFPQPPNIVQAQVDTKSGLLPSPLTPSRFIQTFDFISGTVPTQTSDVWTQVQVDSAKPSLLWSPACPAPPETGVFLKRPTDILIGPQFKLPNDSSLWVPSQSCSGGGPGGGGQSSTVITIQGGAAQPTSIPATLGQPMALTIQNNDQTAYVFQFPWFGVGTQSVPAGGQVTVTFTPDQVGTFAWTISGAPNPISGNVIVSGQSPPSGGGGPSGGGPSGNG